MTSLNNGYAALATMGHSSKMNILGDGGLFSSLFSAAGEITDKVISNVKEQKAAEQSEKDSASALAAAIAADHAATEATLVSLISDHLKKPSAAADLLVAQQAGAVQDAAAAGLSPENQKKRAADAQQALSDATKAWQKASAGKDKSAADIADLRVKAAQFTYGKTQNTLIQKGLPPGPPAASVMAQANGSGSWLTRPVLGPIPGWGVLVGGTLLLAGGAALVLRLRK